MRPTNVLLAVTIMAASLAACSEYTDRRDSISLDAGNSVATDIDTQMVDPWPAASGDKNIAFNGEKMQSAVQRYRLNKVIKPVGVGTSGSYQSQDSGNAPPATDPAGSPPPPPKSP